MTNAELQDAIKYASQRIREISPNEPQYMLFNEHLRELLQEQARRALKEQST